jgi:hypothetical protein
MAATDGYPEYFEVWVQDYNTFGDGDSYIYERYRLKDAADFHCAFLNQGWGRRAEVRRVGDAKIRDISVRDLKNELITAHGSYGKEKLEELWDEHRKAKKN